MEKKGNSELYLRNFIFGVEDSLVSTVGLLSGIAVAGVTKSEIIVTGIILIFVEAFSMGTGSYLSEHSVEEFEKKGNVTPTKSLIGALVMFSSYILAGVIPIFPYLILNGESAFIFSIGISLLGLLVLGIVSAQIFKTKVLRRALEMLVVGGLAVLVGTLVGKLLNNL